MKKEETPQDKSTLEQMTRELYYVKNSDGTYDTSLSTGWDVKKEALDNAWEGIHERVESARIAVEQGLRSPIYYHMEKSLMSISLLSSYMKFSRLRVWWHLRPMVYKKLNPH
ncbi:MAG: hypothetical protein NTV01_14385, partial [Bacteroidia bacterium]|nr:hypothetical protein [Bacteroidia bacterium]